MGISFGRESMGGMGFENEIKKDFKEDKEDQELKKTIEEKYCFNPAKKFDEKDLNKLAHLERYFSIRKNDMKWEEKEAERCELKKGLEADLLEKMPLEVGRYWQELPGKYCKKFDEKVKGEEKYSPDSLKKKFKRRTILDEEDESMKKAGWSREADNSFKSMRDGINSEIVAHNVLKEVLGYDVKMTNSATDINNKIDVLAISDKEILAVQVKTSMLNIMRKNNSEIIEEVSSESKELEKRKFFEGCSKIEKDLKLGGLGVKLRKIWFIIPMEYKRGDSGAYDRGFGEKVKDKFEKILQKANA